MKKLLFILMILLNVSTHQSPAQDATPSSTESTPARLHISDLPQRTRSIIPLWIDCYYSSGEMFFKSSATLNNMTVFITDLETGYSSSYHIIDSNSSISVELSSGIYQILCISDGNEYEGLLNI